MRIIAQRVRGRVAIESRIEGQATDHSSFEGVGLVVLLGWMKGDTAASEEWLVSRVLGLRVFPDAEGRMNLALEDYLKDSKGTGGILWVPQFTLGAKLESGFRPAFTDAMEPALARERFKNLRQKLEAEDRPYRRIFGHFGADMDLSFTNWGPVTIPLEKI